MKTQIAMISVFNKIIFTDFMVYIGNNGYNILAVCVDSQSVHSQLSLKHAASSSLVKVQANICQFIFHTLCLKKVCMECIEACNCRKHGN